jgi:hypothetical protein
MTGSQRLLPKSLCPINFYGMDFTLQKGILAGAIHDSSLKDNHDITPFCRILLRSLMPITSPFDEYMHYT